MFFSEKSNKSRILWWSESAGEWIFCNCSIFGIGIQPTPAPKPGCNHAGATTVGVLCAGERVSLRGLVGGCLVRLLSLLHFGCTRLQALYCSWYDHGLCTFFHCPLSTPTPFGCPHIREIHGVVAPQENPKKVSQVIGVLSILA